MRTPMQEMLEWVRATLPMDLDTPMLIEEKIQSLLKKEKNIIDESYQEGYQNGHEAAMNYTDSRKCKCGLAQVGGFTCARTDCDQNITYGDNK